MADGHDRLCRLPERVPPVRLIELAGKRFGRLTVSERDWSRVDRVHWSCICVCGRRASVAAKKLRSGHTRSCGCLSSDVTAARNYKHGLRRSPLYNTWAGIKQRCFDKNHPAYPDYGGRGITVCARWLESYEHFLADMGPRPDGRSIDRINNDGNYEPSNCRWATRKEQVNNRRRTKLEAHEPEQIRWLRSLGYKYREIAAHFGISSVYVGDIVKGRVCV